jgi:hypothetical protein
MLAAVQAVTVPVPPLASESDGGPGAARLTRESESRLGRGSHGMGQA